jgi:hypothetical protein
MSFNNNLYARKIETPINHIRQAAAIKVILYNTINKTHKTIIPMDDRIIEFKEDVRLNLIVLNL